MATILSDVKTMLEGLDENNASFDADIILYINSLLLNYQQLGVMDNDILVTVDEDTEWEELGIKPKILPAAKTYLAMKVRAVFDPPTSTTVSEALNNAISEYEWRMSNEFGTT